MSLLVFQAIFIILALTQATQDGTAEKAETKVDAQRLRIEGEEAFKSRNYAKAIQYFTDAIKLEPNEIHYYRRGLVYSAKDMIPQAITDFTKALNVKADYTFAVESRYKTYLLLGDFQSALGDLKTLKARGKAVDDVIKSTESRLRQKHTVQQDIADEDCVPQSVRVCKELIVDAPFDRECGYFVSQCLLIYGETQEALVYSGKLVKLDNTDADAILIRAKAFLYMDGYDMVKKHIKSGLSANSEHFGLKNFNKKYKFFNKLKDKAEEGKNKNRRWVNTHNQYKELISIFPNYENRVHDFFVSLCYTARRAPSKYKFKYRLDICSEAVEYKKEAQALAERGRLYFGEQKWEESVRDWEAAVNKDNQNRQYQQELNKAKQEYKKAKRKDYYKILNTHKHATAKDLKKAFRKCATKYHPDKFVRKTDEEKEEAEGKYLECVEANDILTDADLKRRYDSGEDVLETLQGGNKGGGHGNGNPFHFFHGGRGQRFHFRHG